MADESAGHYWNQAAKEREAMERHDTEHPGDPTQWWQDCEICFERVQKKETNHVHV